MSSSQVTPRKRKVSGAELPTRSAGKGKSRGMPTPNPPLVPFPTPPSTRHRSSKHLIAVPSRQPVFTPEDVITPPQTPSSSSKILSTQLPPHLQTLLQLHNAFNLALSLYIATHPPVLPPHPPSATSVELANLTTYLAIKETVERTSGRRFGSAELARLAWIWQWDGLALPGDRLVSESHKGKGKVNEDENPFLVSSDCPSTSSIRVGGLSYLITPTRTLDTNGRKTHTYGLGIELELKAGETRQILLGGSEGGLGNRGQGGGMAAVGRWNAGQEAREEVFRQRLEKWVDLNGGYEPPVQTALPTPSATGSSRSSIPPIPLLPLPHVPQSTLLPPANLFSSPTKLDAPIGLTSLPKKAALEDPFVLDDGTAKSKIVRTGSVEERRQAMMDRIKARSGKTTTTLGSAVGKESMDRIRPQLSAAEQHEALKKRSTLSRLEGIAEAVWMMFSAPSPGPSTLPTPPRGRRKAIPLQEVADVIVKSSKTPISLAEAQTSLHMLTDLCPFFLTVKTVARKEWLEMPSGVATLPPSPGSSVASSRLAFVMGSLNGGSPGARSTLAESALGSGFEESPIGTPRTPQNTSPSGISRLPAEPSSPTPGSKSLLLPLLSSPSKTPLRARTELAGPASPGRVRRQGGLREVREIIRRALGE